MKVTILVILIIGVSCDAAFTKPIYRFPPKQSEMYVEAVVKCVAKLGYDLAILDQIRQGKYTDDDKSVEALVCANNDIGYGLPNGQLDADKTIQDLFPTKPEIKSVFDKCDKDYGVDPAGNFKAFLLCFKDEIPFKVII
ncbi:hypothetical protein O3G_MSEX000256 [Manduca sexta]|nr:hypothetical protein O3G_MSEX000256 [Manduca sexta]KAG6438829.1 hypothetical protein O3G_MSEX000256 [Manduca sexta]